MSIIAGAYISSGELTHGSASRVGLSSDSPDRAYRQFAVRLLVAKRGVKTAWQVGMGEIEAGARRRVNPLPLIEDRSEIGGWVRPHNRREHSLLSPQPLIQHAHRAQSKPAWDEPPEVALLGKEQVAHVLDGGPLTAGRSPRQHRRFVAFEEGAKVGLVGRHGCENISGPKFIHGPQSLARSDLANQRRTDRGGYRRRNAPIRRQRHLLTRNARQYADSVYFG